MRLRKAEASSSLWVWWLRRRAGTECIGIVLLVRTRLTRMGFAGLSGSSKGIHVPSSSLRWIRSSFIHQ